MKKTKERKIVKEKKQDAGYIWAFLERDGKHQSVNYLHSCVQDAILNCAIQLDVSICKNTLFRDFPPSEFENINIQHCIKSTAVRDKLTFKRIHLEREKGGAVYNLLQIIGSGVYLCLCTAKYIIWPNQPVTEKHAFVYNSEYREEKNHWILGAIIDNRQNEPIFLIEEKDRESKEDSRKVFNDFFKADVTITNVFLVEPITHDDTEDNIEIHARKKQKI